MAQTDKPDHKPIIWGNKLSYWGPKLLRFNNSWFSGRDFLSFCETKWEGYQVNGWAAFIIAKRLRLLKADIKDWCISHKSQDEISVQVCTNDIKFLKNCFKSRDLTDIELASLAELKLLKKKLKIRIDSKRRIQFHYHWLKLGDKNSKFFHLVSRIKKQSSHITGLKMNGSWEEDPCVIKQFVVDYFAKLFKPPAHYVPVFDWASLKLAHVPAHLEDFLVSGPNSLLLKFWR
ncbi:uncharacterized protein [Rutidosis leptorrhynchoides]|uniref:uncharacterized protein n=1 Tax=Rutidosis leptorrhynchoides TaxID=125765 RepID=UPI003A992806